MHITLAKCEISKKPVIWLEQNNKCKSISGFDHDLQARSAVLEIMEHLKDHSIPYTAEDHL